MINANEKESLFYIVENEFGKQAGLVSIDAYQEKNAKELSYQFLPEYWGKGLAFQSIQSFIEKAKPPLKLKELYAETQKKNQKSRNLLERIGMEEVIELERFNEIQIVYRKVLE
jgi:RimJ/RimL family protein N-acetyltransferase